MNGMSRMKLQRQGPRHDLMSYSKLHLLFEPCCTGMEGEDTTVNARKHDTVPSTFVYLDMIQDDDYKHRHTSIYMSQDLSYCLGHDLGKFVRSR